MSNPRITALEQILVRNPGDHRALFGLAAEYERVGSWSRVAELLQTYLAAADDQGNAWGRLGRALREIGREHEAKAAYERGVQAARAHGHPSMAAEFEDILDQWE